MQPVERLKEFVEESISPVNSYNEWDPLEEIIVGHLDGAVIPPYHISTVYNIPRSTAMLYRPFAGRRYPGYLVNRAKKELEEFVHILESEGVTVRRPDKMNFSATTKTPYWSSKGFCVACPRDTVLIVGDEIIETPTAWRCRHFEMHAYRSLFKEYFRKGARWTAAPRPQLLDDLYVQDFKPPEEGERRQEAFIKVLKDWGFKPIPCSFVYYPPFGGAFHCATLDVRRLGTLQSYF